MPTFTLEIDTDNAAFEESPTGELARILREVADDVEEGYFDRVLSDSNGNRVGHARLR